MNQIEIENFQLLYTTSKEEMSNVQNEANSLNNTSLSCMKSADINNQNLNQSCSFELLFILYSELQLANLDLWNG